MKLTNLTLIQKIIYSILFVLILVGLTYGIWTTKNTYAKLVPNIAVGLMFGFLGFKVWKQ